MSLQEIINAHNNQPWEVEDPTNRDQCFDLAFGWTDNLGIPRGAIRHLYAYQIFTIANDLTYQYFDIIRNAPDNYPEPGDLVVWGMGVGVAGHVAIAVSANTNSFQSFDQNWDTANYHDGQGNPICRLVNHNYNYVIGWLRPKSTNQGEDMIQDKDNEYGRWNKLAVQIRGRDSFSREEFRQAAVGRTWLQAMEILSDDAEADDNARRAKIGGTAIRDNWEKQIHDAVGAAEDRAKSIILLQAQLADLQKQVDDQKRQIEELKALPPKSTDSKFETLKALIRELFNIK